MLSREEMLRELLQAAEENRYYAGPKEKLEAMDEKELTKTYANMINYLSDARTHTDW